MLRGQAMIERSMAELDAGLVHICEAPKTDGVVELIVRRPETDARELLSVAVLDTDEGLVGDNWRTRGSRKTEDGSAHPGMQLNLMNARVTELLAGNRERWPLAGDQFYVDLDLSDENLPPGTLLHLGETLVEVTGVPHLGCKKFSARFGRDAMLFVNSELGKQLNLRGINARVIEGGEVKIGDRVSVHHAD